MQVPYNWLKEFVDVDLPAREVADRLTMMGLEVEGSEEIEGSVVFSVGVTSNRGDCLSMLGVARELAANTGKPLVKPQIRVTETGPDVNTLAAVEIHDPDLCPRYTARVIQNVVITSSPTWAAARLVQCGMRPINSVVDATNLVMLELGQPLHAFDADLLQGDGRYQIIVRRAHPGEVMTTLDGEQHELNPDNLVIADAERAVALAGVMGGANSEVSWQTTNVLLESAHFDRISIRRTARAYGFNTEASYRFERIVDPGGTVAAVDRLAQLIIEFGGGELATGVVDEYPRVIMPVTIDVRPTKVNAVLGTDLPAGRMAEYLGRLEIPAAEQGDTLVVTAPTFRPDLQEEIDIVEEVARVYGYQHIKERLWGGEGLVGGLAPKLAMMLRANDALRGAGLSQAMTYSLEAADVHDRLNLPPDSPLRNAVVLRSPKSEEYVQLRTTMLSSMLEALANNARRGCRDVQLFEVAKVFLPRGENEQPAEPLRVAVAMSGVQWGASWSLPAECAQSDFYSLKGTVQALIGEFSSSEPVFEAAQHPTLHPGRTARVLLDGREVGIMGEVSPVVAANYDLSGRAYLAELDFDAIAELAGKVITYRPLSRFPAIRRDIALLLDEAIPSAQVEAIIREAAGESLESLALFDMYAGQQVPAGKKSLAYALTFRALDRTLTDAEVDDAMAAVRAAVAQQVGAQPR